MWQDFSTFPHKYIEYHERTDISFNIVDIASTHLSPLKTHQFPHHEGFNGYLPKGYPDIEKNHLLNYDNSKALRIFGPELTYRTMEETTKDILDDYAAKGW